MEQYDLYRWRELADEEIVHYPQAADILLNRHQRRIETLLYDAFGDGIDYKSIAVDAIGKTIVAARNKHIDCFIGYARTVAWHDAEAEAKQCQEIPTDPAILTDIQDRMQEQSCGTDPDFARLYEALDAMPEDKRELILRFYFLRQSIREVAFDLGITIPAVKNRLLHARQRLRDMLQMQYDEIGN